ncbi:MAG: hypothetical protein EPN93_01015 [Spirochaetes bacterium]|nr:MAG: hypothetical protein EPN93_01015 [Spirochaetota bacterium]
MMTAIISLLLQFAPHAVEDYRQIFGRNYQAAVMYVIERRPWLVSTLRAYGQDPGVLVPAVFPELVRYSLLRDKMETGGLIVFYVNLGKEYANFSVGRFQMKPAFVEKLERAMADDGAGADSLSAVSTFPSNDPREMRVARVARLRDDEWQLRYLACFAYLLDRRFGPRMREMDAEERIRFVSTAYNRGFDREFDDLVEWQGKRVYPYGPGSMLPQYNYADIAADFYRRYWKDMMEE